MAKKPKGPRKGGKETHMVVADVEKLRIQAEISVKAEVCRWLGVTDGTWQRWKNDGVANKSAVERLRAFVPVKGEIGAGPWRVALEDMDPEDWLEVPTAKEGKRYALRVVGTSMVGLEIRPGDYVIVRPQDSAEHGDTVIAMVDDNATVKHLHAPTGAPLELRDGEGSAIKIERPDELRIVGKVVNVWRVLDESEDARHHATQVASRSPRGVG